LIITKKGRVITLEDDIQRAWRRHGWKVEEERVPAGVDKKGRRTWIIKAKPIHSFTRKLLKKVPDATEKV